MKYTKVQGVNWIACVGYENQLLINTTKGDTMTPPKITKAQAEELTGRHTDGEWVYCTEGPLNPPYIKQIYYDSQNRRCTRLIAEVLITNGREKETNAIGDLIASAPKMQAEIARLRADKEALLAALDKIVGELPLRCEVTDIAEAAIAAIAKAQKES